MKVPIKKILSAVVVSFFCVFGVFNNIFADDVSSSLTVSPRYQKIILIPGEQYKSTISVSNSNEAKLDLHYYASVGSFNQQYEENASGVYGGVDTDTISSYNQIVDWIKIDNPTGVVSPNNTDSVSFTIDVPVDAPAGGQYATILIRNDTNNDASNGNVGIRQNFQFASIIYAEVAGETRNTGEIIENSIPAFLTDGSNFEATSMVENTGNVHTDSSYTLQVWPLFSDEEICTNEEKPDTSLILPGTKRYHAQKCELPAIGIFNVKQVVKIFDQVSTVERMVIVCPIWLLFLVIFLIALGVIYLFAKTKKRKND